MGRRLFEGAKVVREGEWMAEFWTLIPALQALLAVPYNTLICLE